MKSRQYSKLGFLAVLVASAAGGCGGGSGEPPDAAVVNPVDAGMDGGHIVQPKAPWFACSDTDVVGATVVAAHDHSHHYNATRTIDATVDLPAGDWQQVLMRVELTCPADGFCDVWDRGASLTLIEDEGDTKKRLELARYMTPYGRGFCFVADVSDLASHLQGKKTIRSFIDTWVGPDDPHNGHGWGVTTSFIYRAGARDPGYASEVIPLWENQGEERLVTIGDSGQPVADALPKRTVAIPADAKKVKLRYIVTGHGQGGGDNCAEFCQLQYRTSIGDQHLDVVPWRPDCDQNPVSPQGGTWRYARAGWCPGAYSAPHIVDITDKVTPGTDALLTFSVLDGSGAEFVNTCRPGAGDALNHCTGCTSDPAGANNCDYNYNGHTQPEARISVDLLVYR